MCRLTINIIVHNRLDMTQACIESLITHTTEPFTLQVFDNASTDGTSDYLRNLAAKHKWVRVFSSDTNEGFPTRQNMLAALATTPYICVLNNDVEVGHGWQEPLLAALEGNPRLAQVGPSAPAIPVQYGGQWIGRPEYIEGWCFIIPKWVQERFGLFSPDFYFAYFEDTDLSLRLQEAGYSVAAIPTAAVHLANATRTICDQDVVGYEIRNQQVFLRRWKYYLRSRSFKYRCKIIRASAHGDVLMLTPALRALRKKWPLAFIAVETDCPEMLLHNPCVDLIIPFGKDWNHDWDVVWDLTDASEMQLEQSPMQTYCRALGVSADVLKPEFHLTSWDRKSVKPLLPEGEFAVFHIGKSWHTKMWSYTRFKALGLMLQEKLGLRVVEVGNSETPRLWLDHDLRGRLTWKQFGALLEHARVFVGIDSGPAHIAQALGTPSVLLFGPTDPRFLVHADAPVRAVYDQWLKCTGCYHHHPAGSRYAECVRGDVKCMSNLTVKQVFSNVKEVIKSA